MNDAVWELNQRRQKLLHFLFKERSFSKIVSSVAINRTFILGLIFMAVGYGSIIFNLANDNSPNSYALIIPIPSLIISLFLFLVLSIISRNNIRKKYNRNEVTFDWTGNYSSFIHSYRADELKSSLSNFKIDLSNIDDEILYYESLHQSGVYKVWRNIGIAVVIISPLWNELVGKVIDLDLITLLLLAISAILLSILAMSVTYFIDNIFLAKVVKYKKTAAILRDLKQIL
ncbi:hypothetical protein PTI45_00318 [Paenibacillus nuruki]|uniref:Uncharacterized protein n=1 Tax=Paenibacillus nuruki TaxID=1886670 RepID=A0A1E3L912_9BACL|nr:hypothetical protein [Paenibacillus nuruki]ODP30248.1 hypothetical protein PTI45_00318 [Paenibacillus nuruki]